MTEPHMTLYGVWEYHNGYQQRLHGVHSDVDTLRRCSNEYQSQLKSKGHRGTHQFEDGAMKSDVFSYFNGDRIWKAWLVIEELPFFK